MGIAPIKIQNFPHQISALKLQPQISYFSGPLEIAGPSNLRQKLFLHKLMGPIKSLIPLGTVVQFPWVVYVFCHSLLCMYLHIFRSALHQSSRMVQLAGQQNAK